MGIINSGMLKAVSQENGYLYLLDKILIEKYSYHQLSLELDEWTFVFIIKTLYPVLLYFLYSLIFLEHCLFSKIEQNKTHKQKKDFRNKCQIFHKLGNSYSFPSLFLLFLISVNGFYVLFLVRKCSRPTVVFIILRFLFFVFCLRQAKDYNLVLLASWLKLIT